jgi:diguanylate cyclase (GGDEF)-like protein
MPVSAAVGAGLGLLVGLLVACWVAHRCAARVRHLELAARSDAKTGLLNARAWEHLARRELARMRRAARSGAVLVIDIDGFKLVNDRFGHLTGDAVLRRVGAAIAGGVRESDTVGRFGGEEFVALLPGASALEALAVGERLRARVRQIQTGADLAVSVSVGAACWPTDGADLDALLDAADRALYRAKACGRDRVVLAGG